MKISVDMNLQELEAIMGDCLYEHDVRSMRDVLVARFDGNDTKDVPEADWDDAWGEATARVMALPGL